MKNTITYISDTEARVSKAFEKKARIFGTEEYKLWKAYREDYPAAQMVTKSAMHSNKNRNLTYVNMELYIKEENPAMLAEFA